jgi:hypothetical protein
MRRIPLLHSLWFAIPVTLVVDAGNVVVDQLTRSYWGDALTVVYFAAYGLYCVQNYLNCREAHCLITGPGFLLAAGVMLVRDLGLVQYGIGCPIWSLPRRRAWVVWWNGGIGNGPEAISSGWPNWDARTSHPDAVSSNPESHIRSSDSTPLEHRQTTIISPECV